MSLQDMRVKDLADLYYALITRPILNVTATTITFRVAWGLGYATYLLQSIAIGIQDVNDSISQVIHAAKRLSANERLIFSILTGVQV